jgi:hypothetical protein
MATEAATEALLLLLRSPPPAPLLRLRHRMHGTSMNYPVVVVRAQPSPQLLGHMAFPAQPQSTAARGTWVTCIRVFV